MSSEEIKNLKEVFPPAVVLNNNKNEKYDNANGHHYFHHEKYLQLSRIRSLSIKFKKQGRSTSGISEDKGIGTILEDIYVILLFRLFGLPKTILRSYDAI